MKNYKKIYNRLVKEIKKEIEAHKKHITDDLRIAIENKYGVTVLNWLLSILPEIEGKECQMLTMNHKEFKKWKKNIKN